MMTVYRYAMRSFLYLRYGFHLLSRTGAFGRGQARFFAPSPGDRTGSALRSGLFRHHVRQFHESSCSVASVVSAINTLIERQRPPLKAPVTQGQILDRVREAYWKERMGPNGYQGKRGLPLEVLFQVVRASMEAYAIQGVRVEMVRARGGRHASEDKALLHRHLMDFQVRDKSLIIAHFDQGSFLKELNIPHISPVGGFDPTTGAVTVLDVDRTLSQPYQVPFTRFYRGISTRYAGFFTPFGYGRGGYIRIALD